MRSIAFVEARRAAAAELGVALAGDVFDPEAFATRLRRGLDEFADAEYREGQRSIAPGLGATLGVRNPLLTAIARGFRKASRRARPSELLYVVDRLFREEPLEIRWLALGFLERLVVADPERSWQLLRQAAHEAGDWITVDTLAHPVGRGILSEPYRWAELEQLVYSPSRWERRLVGSTIATIPFIDRTAGRMPVVSERGLTLVGELIGDDAPEVQKALSWALRSLALVDGDAVTAFANDEADEAVRRADGYRAWVIRDALEKIEPAAADQLRGRLSGVRRRPAGPSTSRAAGTASRFGRLPDPRTYPQPPLDAPSQAAMTSQRMGS